MCARLRRQPSSVSWLDELKKYDGAWHVRINDQWRLTFKWGESGPYDVLIEDPH